jgi:uncharacterized protein YdhG (YjbR/CyaY superfamily)
MSKQEVDAWFDDYDLPQKALMQEVRRVMLAADSRLGETIKWKTPTFTCNGNLASFNPRSKKHVSLLVHNGARIRGNFPSLEGSGDEARTMKFMDANDLVAKTPELERLVAAWCDWKSN